MPTAGEPRRLPRVWVDVRALALEALGTFTKDLEIVAWLAEAELRLAGFAGLRDVFAGAAALVREHWDGLFSIDGDLLEDKVAPLAGLNGVGSEGALIPPIRLTPLVPQAPFFELCLWDFQISERPGEEGRRQRLREAVTDAGEEAMRAQLQAVTGCIAAFDDLTAALDERCGPHAPPSGNIRMVLEEVRLAIAALTGFSEPAPVHLAVQPDAQFDAPSGPAPGGAVSPAQRAGEIASREEAFESLLKIARYFRETEPHSPLSLAIETLVARGRMDFIELLEELVPDPQARRALLITAGIQPNSTVGT